jgi:transcriptional regulator with XRE-family HTH domain
MSIGTTIKQLRLEHDMTQEQLAELLHLSSAAISGWECDRNSPDISQIPLLARIFNVSADFLLGIDLSVQEEKICRIIMENAKYSGKEAVDKYRLALAEYPSSYDLMLRLANVLDYPEDLETYDSRVKEQIKLYEKIRAGTKDAHLKNCAEGWLCRIYLNQGERDRALRIAEEVPILLFSHEDFDRMLAQGMEKVYHMHYSIQKSFATLCDDICFLTGLTVDGRPVFSHEQAVAMLEKIPKLYEIFYEEGDYLNHAVTVSMAYSRMAEYYADLKDADQTLRCVKLALKYAKQVDAYYADLPRGSYGISDVGDAPQLPMSKRHTSLLANPVFDYPTCTFWIDNDEEMQVQHCMKAFFHTRFDFIRSEIEKLI